MFEKSLVDLIRGMRKYAGNERDYMQKCLKECRSEIQSQDMGMDKIGISYSWTPLLSRER